MSAVSIAEAKEETALPLLATIEAEKEKNNIEIAKNAELTKQLVNMDKERQNVFNSLNKKAKELDMAEATISHHISKFEQAKVEFAMLKNAVLQERSNNILGMSLTNNQANSNMETLFKKIEDQFDLAKTLSGASFRTDKD